MSVRSSTSVTLSLCRRAKSMPRVSIPAADGGEFSAYLSLPPNGTETAPGIIMMQQIFGVNPEMRGFTDDFAARGYIAICPDLFWRLEPGVEIIPGTPEAFQKALGFARRFDHDRAVRDLIATLAFLRAHPSCNGRVGTVGYCLGGLLAFLMAARSDADCHVGYFGVGIERHIDEAKHLARPLLLHIPDKDRHVPPEAQAVVKRGLEGKAILYTYPDADHAFNRITAPSYNAEVTALADARTLAFLNDHLAG